MCNGIYRPLMNWSNTYRIQGLLGTKLQYFTASDPVLNCLLMRVGFNPKCSKSKSILAFSGILIHCLD